MNIRLEKLINGWLDGELEDAEAAAVQKLLAEDPEARKICYELLVVDKLLDERARDGLLAKSTDSEETADDSNAPIPFPPPGNVRFLKPLAIAAAAALVALIAIFPRGKQAFITPVANHAGPDIERSSDCRITIAQRQDGNAWNVGELLRLERGTVAIRLNDSVSANLEGPAAVELVDQKGNLRLLEGIASFEVRAGGSNLDVQVPAGILRDLNSRYTAEVLTDGKTNVWVESGFLEIRPRRSPEPMYLKKGESVQLEANGEVVPVRLPSQHFRSGLPDRLVLFDDDFTETEEMSLVNHKPKTGEAWKVPYEVNPTILRNGILDTSSGARQLLTGLSPHKAGGPRSVYMFTFHLVPPSRIDDKVNRKDGVETVTLVDDRGEGILSVVASAAYGHRWQLRDERSKAATAVTPVCALWTHSLTLCYGLDGRTTLHDGSSAQAPVIAEFRVSSPVPVGGLMIGNRDGGDLAFTGIESVYLPDYSVQP